MVIGLVGMMAASQAFAQTASAPATAAAPTNGFQKNQPIEISSDKLDVYQDQHKAIFTGNVIAVQADKTLRSVTMTVYYRDSNPEKPAKPAKPVKPGASVPPPAPPTPPSPKPTDPEGAQGIYRIDADENVVFTTPTETAVGDKGIYDVDANTIDLTGKIVTLTRGQNILKGTHAVYDMNTDRSVLTNNGTVVDGNGNAKPARVHGLFVPTGGDDSAPANDKKGKKAGAKQAGATGSSSANISQPVSSNGQ